MSLRRLTNMLVRSGNQLPWRDAADRTSPSLAAWRAYDDGRAGIARWDLPAAEASFRAAITSDAQQALAQLWLAQTLVWKTAPPPAEVSALVRHALDGNRLESRDSLRATALLALSERQYLRSRAIFRALIASDSADYTAWLGLAECERQDAAVIPDARTSTHLAFRGSFEEAARAYLRAGDSGPSMGESGFPGWLLGRMSAVLYTETNHVRRGFVAGADTVHVASFPYLDHDTLAFAPYDLKRFGESALDPDPDSFRRAIDRNRVLLRHAAEDWVKRAPQSAAAYDSLAGWMETSGGIADVDGRQVSTLEVVRHARSLARDSLQQMHLAVAEVRLLVKGSEFAKARALADSLLRHGATARNRDVPGVPGLAALLGHVSQAATLARSALRDDRLQLANGRVVPVSSQLLDAHAQLRVYAGLGVDGDSVQSLIEFIIDGVRSYFPSPTTAAQVRDALLAESLALMFPAHREVLQAVSLAPNATVRAYVTYARGDTAAAHSELSMLHRIVTTRSPGNSIDLTYERAKLLVLLGDTTSARMELDPILRALPTLSPTLLFRVDQTAALVRAFALRADIAARAHDSATAKRWAMAVLALWSDGDPELRPVLDRMRVLSH